MNNDMKVLFTLSPIEFPELSDDEVYAMYEYLQDLVESFEEHYFKQIYR